MANCSDRQLDLFGSWQSEDQPDGPGVPNSAETLSDQALVSRLPTANWREIQDICAEIRRRSLAMAGSALHDLWRRYTGFGRCKPLREQIEVIRTLDGIGGAGAAGCLRKILLSDTFPPPLLATLLSVATRKRLNLPADHLITWSRHEEPKARALTFELAAFAGRPGPSMLDCLETGLDDPSQSARRAAAITLGGLGKVSVRGILLTELKMNPDEAVIQALGPIADDDTIVFLGRLAHKCPELKRHVVGVLSGLEMELAENICRGLEKDG